ncbi:MAG: glycosyltransferase family 1 protein, partial [bacterium]
AIIITGYVAAEDKPALYNLAEMFVFPSLSEGFGLPPLEAMACGTPVIVSDRGALPEVVADAAITVAAEDARALAEAIVQVATSPEIRADLGRRGIRRAQQFSWRRTALATWEVLRRYG